MNACIVCGHRAPMRVDQRDEADVLVCQRCEHAHPVEEASYEQLSAAFDLVLANAQKAQKELRA